MSAAMRTPCARPQAAHRRAATVALLMASVLAGGAEGGGSGGEAVTLQDDGSHLQLANAVVALRIRKEDGTLVSFRHQGQELLAAGGGYVQIAFTSRRDNPRMRWTCQVVRQGPALVEIAFADTGLECPFTIASHYILRAGDPGFYHHLVWGHDPVRQPRVIRLAQLNLALRIDPTLFTIAAVDDQRIARFPDAGLLTPAATVMDATYRLPDGSHYSKYFFAAERDGRHVVHGAMGDGGRGLWVIMPSHEHLNGGPEHQELTVHQAGASQVLLAHAQGAHYGAGILVSDPRDGPWTKVSAPWFIYANQAASPAACWQDAQRRAAQEVAAWPHPWLDDARFQLRRGSVSGRLVDGGGRPVAGARIILADHEEASGPLQWQQQWRGYRFPACADQDGRFTVAKVRAGLYDLYAWQPGTWGWFLQRGVRVGVGEDLACGEKVWRQDAATTLWQIGVPDRSAAEFGFAEDFRRWGLWTAIAVAHPGGVDYIVGRHGPRDWPFQMAVTQQDDRTWRGPVWRIAFDSAGVRSGQARLSLGIAAYEGRQKPQLSVSLNGEALGAITDLEVSGAVHRSGIHAGYQERTITFDAARIRKGSNQLVLAMAGSTRPDARRAETPSASLLWDALRLALLKDAPSTDTTGSAGSPHPGIPIP